MLPLLAELTVATGAHNLRGSTRRALRLEVYASSAQHEANPLKETNALIRNLSQRGLLIETTADLVVGEEIEVGLPEAGAAAARVIWTKGSFFGCEFLTPVSKAAVSAALLLAPVERAPTTALPNLPQNSAFGEDRAQTEFEPEAHSPGVDFALMASLIVALFMAALFIYALLTFPFSM